MKKCVHAICISFPRQAPRIPVNLLFLPFPLFFLILLAYFLCRSEGSVILKKIQFSWECLASWFSCNAATLAWALGLPSTCAIIHSKLSVQSTGRRQLPRQVACMSQSPRGKSTQQSSRPFDKTGVIQGEKEGNCTYTALKCLQIMFHLILVFL